MSSEKIFKTQKENCENNVNGKNCNFPIHGYDACIDHAFSAGASYPNDKIKIVLQYLDDIDETCNAREVAKRVSEILSEE